MSVFESKRQSIFTSVAWDLAHELLVLADASGTVQMWNTYTKSASDHVRLNENHVAGEGGEGFYPRTLFWSQTILVNGQAFERRLAHWCS